MVGDGTEGLSRNIGNYHQSTLRSTQKSEHLIYTVVAARNHTCHVWSPLWILVVQMAAGCLEHVEVDVVSCGVRRGRGRPQEV